MYRFFKFPCGLLAGLACGVFALGLRCFADDAKVIPVAELQRATPVDFEKEVLPIFRTSCLACHNKTKAKAKLDLETPAAIRKGGDGGPAAIPGKGLESLLIRAAAHAADVDSPMPPPKNSANAPDLTSAQLGLIRLWIDQGAAGEVHDTPAATKWNHLAPVLQPIYAVSASNDGQYAACGRGNRINIYCLSTGRLVAEITDPRLVGSVGAAAHRDLVESLAFTPDGSTLASGSYREIKLWKRPTPTKKFELADVGDSTVCAAASADGKMIAVGDADGTIQLFNAADGSAIGEMDDHDGPVTGVCFSPDGKQLVSVSNDKSARVWDVSSQTAVDEVEAPCELRSVAWIEKGKRIAAGGADGVIRVWSLADAIHAEMRLSAELPGHVGPVHALVANGNQIISGGADGIVRLWDADSGKVIRQIKHGAPVISLAVRKDGKRIASAGMDNAVRLWNAEDEKQIAEMRGDPALAVSAKASERSLERASAEIAYCKARVGDAEKESKTQADRVVAARAAQAAAVKNLEIKQHDVDAAKSKQAIIDVELAARKQSADAVAKAEEVLATLKTPLASDKGAAAENAQIAAALDALKKSREALNAMKLDDRKKVADAAQVAATTELTKATTAKTGADQEMNSAGQSLAAATGVVDRAAAILKSAEVARVKREQDARTAKKQFADSDRLLRSLAFSPDGSLLAVAGDDGLVRTVYSEKGTPGDVIGDRRTPMQVVVFNSDHLLITIGSGLGSAWDLSPAWTLQQRLGSADGTSPIADRVTSLDFSPDGKTLASGGGVPSRGGEVKLWNCADWKLLKSFDEVHVDTINCVRFSPDGRRLACASADRFVRVIDPDTGKILLAFEGHQHHVLGVAWRSDGHIIASSGADNTLRFWNADTGERRGVITTFDKELTSVNFIADTSLALITTGDGRVQSFQVPTGEDRRFAGLNGFVYAAAVTPDGTAVIAGGEDGILRAWEVAGGQLILSANP